MRKPYFFIKLISDISRHTVIGRMFVELMEVNVRIIPGIFYVVFPE